MLPTTVNLFLRNIVKVYSEEENERAERERRKPEELLISLPTFSTIQSVLNGGDSFGYEGASVRYGTCEHQCHDGSL